MSKQTEDESKSKREMYGGYPGKYDRRKFCKRFVSVEAGASEISRQLISTNLERMKPTLGVSSLGPLDERIRTIAIVKCVQARRFA